MLSQGIAVGGAIALMVLVVAGSVYIVRARAGAKYARVQDNSQHGGDALSFPNDQVQVPPSGTPMLSFKEYEDDEPMVQF